MTNQSLQETNSDETYIDTLKNSQTFKPKDVERKDDKLFSLLESLLTTTKEINGIVNSVSEEEYSNVNQLRNDLLHFHEIEKENLSDYSILKLNNKITELSEERRVIKNIISVQEDLNVLSSLETALSKILDNVDMKLNDDKKTYAIRNVEALNILKEIISTENEITGNYSSKVISKNIAKKQKEKEKEQKMLESSIIKRDKPLPPTNFNVKTLADVKVPKSQLNPVTKIPKQITPENVTEFTAMINPKNVQEDANDENVVALPKAMSKNQLNKALRHINMSRKRKKNRH